MKIAVVQPRLSYFSGGGEKIPLELMSHLVDLLDISFDLYTTKSVLSEAPGYTQFKANFRDSKKITIHELPVPKKFLSLYKIQPGMDRYRWDCESLFFNNLVYGNLLKDKPDMIFSFYLPDCVVKPTSIPSMLYLLGYPRTKSDYREAMLVQYDSIISSSQSALDRWNEQL